MRKGLGKGLGMGYKNIAPMDSHIHSLSAKGVKSRLYAQKTLDGGEISDEMLGFINRQNDLRKTETRPDKEYLSVKETGDKITEELEDLKLPDVSSIVRDDFNSTSGDIFIYVKGEEFGFYYALGEDPHKFNMGNITRKTRTVLNKWKKEGKISNYKMYVPEKKYDSDSGYNGYEDDHIEIEYWV